MECFLGLENSFFDDCLEDVLGAVSGQRSESQF